MAKAKPAAERAHLPVIHGRVAKSALHTDGTRERIIPADVHGPFATLRKLAFYLLIATWVALPLIPINGHPALFLDIQTRAFYMFGLAFNSQDIWLLFFLPTGAAFSLVYATALLGRAWCGWACPQTVFLEGVFRPIERLIGGPREKRMRGIAVWRKVLIQVGFILASLFVAHVFVGYFVSLPKLFSMMKNSPGEHPEAFAWVLGITALMYFNFGWFREQFCIVMCPYGRLQSVLLDDDSLIVGYDEKRGEPRGKKGQTTGDCVDCDRCVVVCPTSIDIRNGLQMDCVACTACIDACNDVMDRLERPRGLIRYDSQHGLAGGKTRWLRPRIYVYTGFLAVGAVVFALAARKREPFEANVLRAGGAPFALDGEVIQNTFEVHLVNKGDPEEFDLRAEVPPNYRVVFKPEHVALGAQSNQRVPLFITTPAASFQGDTKLRVLVRGQQSKVERAYTVTFLGTTAGAKP